MHNLKSYKELQKAMKKDDKWAPNLACRKHIRKELGYLIAQAENAEEQNITIEETIKHTKERMNYFIDIGILDRASIRNTLTEVFEKALIYFDDLRGVK